MDEVEIGNIKVDYCRRGCGGQFFDNFELDKMDENMSYLRIPFYKKFSLKLVMK
jgi:Zn-finger nucleic acid-binding protein